MRHIIILHITVKKLRNILIFSQTHRWPRQNVECPEFSQKAGRIERSDAVHYCQYIPVQHLLAMRPRTQKHDHTELHNKRLYQH